MANDQDTNPPTEAASPQMPLPIGMSFEEIRQKLSMVNNPEVPVEIRQRAMVSLMVETLDRMMEMRDALGKGIKRLTEQGDTLDAQDRECMTILQGLMRAPSERAEQHAEQHVENGAVNGKKKKVQVMIEEMAPKAQPEPPPPPPLPADAAAAAAALNQVANVPGVPIVGGTVIKG